MKYKESLDKYLPFFQSQHALFRLLANQSYLYFLDEIPTAAVTMSPEGGHIAFVANEEFWDETVRGFLDKVFVISHEMMHLFLNHLERIGNEIPPEYCDAFNIAADLFINHFIEDHLYLSRNFLCDFLKNEGCWVDTVFGDEEKWGDIEQYRGQSVEFYYNLLRGEKQEYLDELKEKLKSCRVITKEDYDKLSPEQQKQMQEIVQDVMADAGIEPSSGNAKELNTSVKEVLKSIKAGTGSGSFQIIQEGRVKQKKKWESVIKRWCKKTVLDSKNQSKRWGFADRKFNQVQKYCSFHLPGDIRHSHDGEKKNTVAMFLDVSGSCYSYKNTFLAAARTVPNKYFELRIFTFDTRVTEVKKGQGIYAGGGTSFGPIPRAIDQAYGRRNHPDVVFILTDGEGSYLQTKFPEKYVWFLTEYNTTRYIPKESKVFYLDDFIVSL